MSQRIRTRATHGDRHHPPFKLGGWLAGNDTYLWFGEDDTVDERGMKVYGRCFALLSGQPLYRLAKAIVLQFEDARAEEAGAVTRRRV